MDTVTMMRSEWKTEVDGIFEKLWRVDDSLRQGLEGCTEDDIKTIETKFGVVLPGAFIELLMRLGRSRGALMPGADFAYPEILGYRTVAESLFADNVEVALENRDFVFLMHQGYHFLFFKTGSSDNPAVFLYNDDEGSIEQVATSFTEWLRISIDEEAELRASAARNSGGT